uniref:Uncharacterized protein n=1 Tax=Triticum urartu TaxID=4572 RepID=A0A8R7TKJ0_TRIUA
MFLQIHQTSCNIDMFLDWRMLLVLGEVMGAENPCMTRHLLKA